MSMTDADWRGVREYVERHVIPSSPATVPPEVPGREWRAKVREADEACRLIDLHLNTEERGRRMLLNERLTPIGLCPEQRVQMVTDLSVVCR